LKSSFYGCKSTPNAFLS